MAGGGAQPSSHPAPLGFSVHASPLLCAPVAMAARAQAARRLLKQVPTRALSDDGEEEEVEVGTGFLFFRERDFGDKKVKKKFEDKSNIILLFDSQNLLYKAM